MRISINVTDQSWPGALPDGLADVARRAEDAGADTLWLPDHLVQADPTLPPEHDDQLEAYTALGYLAARTSRIRLGTMVSAATFRTPALLVKAVTTLDVLSGGRAWFGVGAGHQAQEAADMGLDLPGTRARLDRLADVLRLARRMWAGDESPFTGSDGLRLERPRCRPAPATPGGPPVLVGGAGERRTLRLVAEHADACNVFDLPDDGATVRHKLAVLADHCADVGRDVATIDRTLSARLAPGTTADELAAKAETAAGWGITHLVLITPRPWDAGALAAVGGAVERVADA
ncbi:LLM class flavin-dependent oxidoreductase [Isoptericola sp. NPDC057653]|uniref:LLM class flavin-dependent oxidoreductase n=1 Tax=Isoptericola sp. NPDC057653 TaxID=3346195 RepID=UPI0036C4695C